MFLGEKIMHFCEIFKRIKVVSQSKIFGFKKFISKVRSRSRSGSIAINGEDKLNFTR